jgi:hypothetical protein
MCLNKRSLDTIIVSLGGFFLAIAAGTKDDHAKAAPQKESEKQDRQLDEKRNCG